MSAALYKSEKDQFLLLPCTVIRHDLRCGDICEPLHWHRSMELMIPLSGQVYCNTGSHNFAGGEADWFVVNSCELHSYVSAPQSGSFRGLSLLISRPFVEKWVGTGLAFYNPEDAAVTAAFQAAGKTLFALDESAPGYNCRVMSILFEIIGLLAQKCAKKADDRFKNMGSDQLLAAALADYVEAHYRDNISLSDVAESFKYSPSHFSRIFKDMLGVNYHDYLAYVRAMHTAEELLSSRDGTVMECCFKHGFCNVKSFNLVFKRIFGTTPRAYVEARREGSALHAAGHNALNDVLLPDQVEDQHG